MKVFICDDDVTTLKRLESLVRDFGLEPVCEATGAKAVSVLTGIDAPKVAILDWNLPGASGIDICKRVRQFHSTISNYILILTANEEPDAIMQAIEAGANDFLNKPFRPIELKARLMSGVRQVNLAEDLKVMSGLIKICSWCKKIHVPAEKEWVKIESYIQSHSYVSFTHGGCPTCIAKATDEIKK